MTGFGWKHLASATLGLGASVILGLGCSDDDDVCFTASGERAIEERWQEGCRSCRCDLNRSVTCDASTCAESCVDSEGEARALGAFWPAGDGCNLCQCLEGGEVSCSENDCGVPCIYIGEQRAPGSSFGAIDGCNSCECQVDGTVTCTEEVCPCDAATEWWRDYAGTTQAECDAGFSCPEQTTIFANACGCGCEQSHACAQSYNCTPPSECDIAQIQADCPYSEILE